MSPRGRQQSTTKGNALQSRSLQLFALGAFVAGCATVAVTGRSQLSLISDEELIRVADRNYSALRDTAQGKNAILQASDSPKAAATIGTVNRVANKIVKAAGISSLRNWEVTVLKSTSPNAMVLPNGKIIVFTGILPIAKNEAGLAAVLGHEVAHIAARHAAERISQVLLANTTLQIATAVAAARNTRYQPAMAAGLGLGLQYGILMPFSRAHESEADRIGQIYMAKAGYDPSEAANLWERMKLASSAKSKFQFLSTHPSDEARHQQLQEWLPQAKLYYQDQGKSLPKSITELEVAVANKTPEINTPIALRPDIREDYWYSIGSVATGTKRTYRYDQLADCDIGKCISIQSESGTTEMTIDYAISRMTKRDGSWVRFSPPIRPVRFPLTVGDTWADDIVFEASDGRKARATIKTTVVSYEPIDVPAGSFMAYRTESSIKDANLFQGWYVPETRTFVKRIIGSKKGKQDVSVLVDYQKSDDPSGEVAGATGGDT